MRFPPLDVYASWPDANYIDPATRGNALLTVNVVLGAVVIVAVFGRWYSRIFIKKWFGIDDWMSVPAFVFTLALTVVVILAAKEFGWELHVWDIPWGLIKSANIIAFAAKIIFSLVATFTRLSLICFYYRLVKDSGIKWFYWVLHASVVWTVAVCIVFIVLTIWLCKPIEYYWIFPPSGEGHCLNEGKVMLGGGVINSVSDLLTTVLPIPIVMRLQMPLKQRIGVCVLLCLGMIVTIAGSVRTYYTWKSLLESWDETWYAYPLWIAAAVEIHLGMLTALSICSCAPAWKSLLQEPIKELSYKLSSKFSSLRSPSNSNNSSNPGKAFTFNPLRSLPWFQITRFEFERTQRSAGVYELQGIESELSKQSTDEQQCTEVVDDAGARQSRHSEIVEEGSQAPMPALRITMRQSLSQSSERIQELP